MVPPPLLGGLCRADPVQVETLAPQQVRRVCTADGVSALASSPQTAGADPAGLAWSALCCTAWHRSTTGAHRCTLIYIIIAGGHVAPVQRPAWRWYLVLVEVQHLTVCPPALRGRCIGGLCDCCIACAGMGKISGNAAAKLCKRFWLCGSINCTDDRKATVNA